MSLLTARCQQCHTVVAERTDDRHHILAFAQFLSKPCEVFSQFIVPLQLQVNAEGVVQLCLVQVAEKPLHRALKAGFRGSVGTHWCHHSHRLLHPSSRLLINDGVVFLLTGGE